MTSILQQVVLLANTKRWYSVSSNNRLSFLQLNFCCLLMVTSGDVHAGTNETSVWYFRAFQDIMKRKFKAAWPRRLGLWEKRVFFSFFQTSVWERWRNRSSITDQFLSNFGSKAVLSVVHHTILSLTSSLHVMGRIWRFSECNLYHIHVKWLERRKWFSTENTEVSCLESRSEMETALTSQLTV